MSEPENIRTWPDERLQTTLTGARALARIFTLSTLVLIVMAILAASWKAAALAVLSCALLYWMGWTGLSCDQEIHRRKAARGGDS